ncbi:BadF/BadG/BcrA/BcrD ATPase family protein [Motiliproteus sp. MSK22-1]|uniref:BadF/BadG/BcrA/BcrD ATPase family protein n=1 Tax=Motiliproteus sp. MSK22-1 TaxID=1897630 RepID=UPI0009772993|nr:BadF/BadG/BcrA/BcrD ATPase family protein [Motiliproteus sp. MSK22-1]OMH33888.1 hypothetical protein BGP75_12980 [Motiliproteus sp. MSK22-1]
MSKQPILIQQSKKQPYFLGVDGGGTSCRVRLCDSEGNTLGEGYSGSANVRLGVETSYRSILEATHHAVSNAGLERGVLIKTHAGMGLAGAISPAICSEIINYPHPFASVAVETDAHIACLGAHQGKNGGILILGTGSCGVALVDGHFHNIGGWGFPISDQGSGAWVGLELLRYALQAHDKVVPSTALSSALINQFNNNPAEIVAWMDQSSPRDYGSFMPLVVEYAEQNDALARGLLRQAAAEACKLLAALRACGVTRISLMGGVSSIVKPLLPVEDQSCLVAPQGDAMDGALLLIRQPDKRQSTFSDNSQGES